MKRNVGCKLILTTLLAGFALCQLPRVAHSTTPSNHIYLQNASGIYVDACATSSYQNNHVFEMATGAIIGTVPPGSFTIFNANNQAIGYLSPDV